MRAKGIRYTYTIYVNVLCARRAHVPEEQRLRPAARGERVQLWTCDLLNEHQSYFIYEPSARSDDCRGNVIIGGALTSVYDIMPEMAVTG